MRNSLPLAAALAFAAAALPSQAATDVRVIVTGVVEWNQFTSGTFAPVRAGDAATMTIDLDSNDFLDSPYLPGKTRGFRFNPSTFQIQIGSVSVPLRSDMNPVYFVLRNNDPAVDGVFISQGTDIDVELPLAMTPNNYGIAFNRTFAGGSAGHPDPTLNSLNLLDAVGSWGFENLSVYNFTIQRGEFSTPLGIEYRTLTIAQCAAINGQPQNATTCSPEAATFSVSAVGTGVTYQWQIELPGSPDTWQTLGNDPFPLPCGGSAHASQPFSASTPIGVTACSGIADYRVRCVVSNVCGSVTSDPATLTVQTCSTCPADFNQDGGIDGADVEAFFNAWESGGNSADVNADGGIDGGDVETFFMAWEAGGC
ncbi:MAG: hypothetical protein JSR77_00930 [Planctomycetes bacterium]|nr:hypothetical protein [Planctomycetota bacterium]